MKHHVGSKNKPQCLGVEELGVLFLGMLLECSVRGYLLADTCAMSKGR